MNKHKRSERGQAIFLIAMALVVLLGFTSLAMDGGRVYSDRRKAQNTADTSAFAGALLIAQSTTGDPMDLAPGTFTAVISAARARATSNAYDYTTPEVDVDVGITVHTDNGVYYLVRVTITSQIETTFAHLVYDGELKNTVYAIAKARPPQNLGFGYAVYATSKTQCDAIRFSGNQNLLINGGGIFSNSNGEDGGCDSMKRSGGSNVNVIGGTIGAAGSYNNSGCGTCISPSVDEYIPQEELPLIPEPDCSSLPPQAGINLTGSGTTTIDPGNYGFIRVGANAKLVMNPGMYCISGTAPGFIGLGGDIEGNGVMIVMQEGSFDLGGNAKVRMYASTDLVVSGVQWAGMLVYMPYDNTGQVTLTGMSGTKYRGTIYAPGPASPSSKPKCIVTGTAGEIGVASQLICYSIKLTGNANINLKYNASQNYAYPASMGLQE
jgi:hypothetical protein